MLESCSSCSCNVIKKRLQIWLSFTGKHLCWSLFLIKLQQLQLQLYQKETSIQVFFSEIFKNTFFYRKLTVAASLCRNYSIPKQVVRSGKKHNHNKVSYNYLGSSTQADHNSRRSQYSLVICNVQKPGIFIIVFLPKEQKSIV